MSETPTSSIGAISEYSALRKERRQKMALRQAFAGPACRGGCGKVHTAEDTDWIRLLDVWVCPDCADANLLPATVRELRSYGSPK